LAGGGLFEFYRWRPLGGRAVAERRGSGGIAVKIRKTGVVTREGDASPAPLPLAGVVAAKRDVF
jgi:hypothetical protein